MLWHDFRVGNMQLLARIVEYIFIHVHYVDAHYIQQPSLLILRYSLSSLSLSPLSPKETRLGHCITNLTQTLVMLFTTKWEPQNCHRFDRFVFFDSPRTDSIFHDPLKPVILSWSQTFWLPKLTHGLGRTVAALPNTMPAHQWFTFKNGEVNRFGSLDISGMATMVCNKNYMAILDEPEEMNVKMILRNSRMAASLKPPSSLGVIQKWCRLIPVVNDPTCSQNNSGCLIIGDLFPSQRGCTCGVIFMIQSKNKSYFFEVQLS